MSSKCLASLPSPVPRLIARSTLSFGMLCARAAWMALRRRRLPVGSPPPAFAAMVISFDNLLKILPRFASIAPLNRLTFDHLLCPAIRADSVQLLIETCEFPNNTSPREWLARRGNSRAIFNRNEKGLSTYCGAFLVGRDNLHMKILS